MSKHEKTIRTLNIGKYGLSENVIKEIKRHLEKHREIKLKFLSSIVHDQESFRKYIEEIKEKLPEVEIAKKIGHTLILRRQKHKH
ncbi:MAG: YhbY family RNA-binding protein [Candidatus Asgardarchaeia archaeon]